MKKLMLSAVMTVMTVSIGNARDWRDNWTCRIAEVSESFEYLTGKYSTSAPNRDMGKALVSA